MAETREEIAKPCKTETDTQENPSYCPHYERDTCLIHFTCCDEEDWYPCHKCHNENLHEKPQEDSKPSMDHSKDFFTTSNISEERRECLEVGGSSQAESSSEPEGLQEVPSTSGEVEEPMEVAGRALDEPSSNKEANKNADNVFERAKENGSQLAVDASPPSPPGNTKTHPVATALDGSRLRCTTCRGEQGFSQNCDSCAKSFASYFCGECKLLIEKKVDPYHCNDCGICRGDKANNFHCDVCNVCMALSLKENHKCFADRGHDPCAICQEEVFSGAVIFPCFHMIHKHCAEELFLYGSHVCPMCRNVIFQDDEDAATSEETTQQMLPAGHSVSRFCGQIGQKISSMPSWIGNWYKRTFTKNGSSGREIEMRNVSTAV